MDDYGGVCSLTLSYVDAGGREITVDVSVLEGETELDSIIREFRWFLAGISYPEETIDAFVPDPDYTRQTLSEVEELAGAVDAVGTC